VTAVVIDASAGAEIVTDTARGRALLRLLPTDAEGWVPQHFYSEVLGVLRHQTVFSRVLTEERAAVALRRLRQWHLRQAAVPPLLEAAWSFRQNMRAADAIYVALATELGAAFLSDDHKLLGAPTFPASIPVLRLPLS
jgi:predicted nucleic acid-binding protein